MWRRVQAERPRDPPTKGLDMQRGPKRAVVEELANLSAPHGGGRVDCEQRRLDGEADPALAGP
eukprot:1359530-Prymnesium_polylepis.1